MTHRGSWLGVTTLLALTMCVGASKPVHPKAQKPAPKPSAPRIPLTMEPNVGQTAPDVQMLARGGGATLFLNAQGMTVSLPAKQGRRVLRMSLEGSNAKSRLSGVTKAQTTSNYFIDNDPKKWRRDVPHFSRAEAENVYPGIDLAFHSASEGMEYDFIVEPHADPADIRMRFKGAESVRTANDGSLSIVLSEGELRHSKPLAYQELEGRRVVVASAFHVTDAGEVGFALGEYDRTRRLVIDPTIVTGTYLGGSSNDAAYGVTVDGSDYVYVTGACGSSNFPTGDGTVTPYDSLSCLRANETNGY